MTESENGKLQRQREKLRRIYSSGFIPYKFKGVFDVCGEMEGSFQTR